MLQIQIQNARTHNLKNISLNVPRDQLVVITGRSGSGKSSLAIDTIFAEGQRQYIESLSLFSRQFFKQLPQADVDLITGLPPTLCLDQQHGVTHRRSTVGTLCEIYDYLRLLMARVGKIHCLGCGQPITQHTPQQVRDQILQWPERTKIMILAPITLNAAGDHQSTIKQIRRERLVRIRVDGEIFDIDQAPELQEHSKHTIDAVTDRIIVREGVESRLLEAIELAERLADGRIAVAMLLPDKSATWTQSIFSTRYACPDCEIRYVQLQPRIFSFNSPHGACEKCQGLGEVNELETDRIIDRRQRLQPSAIAPWSSLSKTAAEKKLVELDPILDFLQWDLMRPLSQMNDQQWDQFLKSDDKTKPGLLVLLAKELAITLDDDRHDELLDYYITQVCPDCRGSRLNSTARCVFVAGKSMGEILKLPIDRAIDFFSSISGDGADGPESQREIAEPQREIAEPIVTEILGRLKFLQEVGVGYLSLGRSANTLSGGEHQRVRLAKSIGSGLTNVCYVLDEPSIGLHQRDNDRLITAIRNLQTSGNSVLLVEHDEQTIRMADQVIDLGPQAGVHGGQVVAIGTPEEISRNPDSLTGDYLAGRKKIERTSDIRPTSTDRQIVIKGASGRNLKSLDVVIPLGVMVCVTGVSGSGKSTLVNETLVPALLHQLDLVAPMPLPVKSIHGLEQIEQLIVVDQKPIGSSLRGCPATVVGILNPLRKIFAATPKAKQLGFGIGRFTFNSKTGWCPECRGRGVKKIEMNVMPDFFVTCQSCQGQRYNLQTLQVKFNERSIADVLAMSIDQARKFFDGIETIARPLQALMDVGLGYLHVGQSTVTLSGGESQRLKLAAELAKKRYGQTMYVLDEPTTGLHFEDVRVLLAALNRLVDHGDCVIVIEHNLDVIRCCDWVIDLGPEGGEQGGQLIGSGPPTAIAQIEGSHTGRYLR